MTNSARSTVGLAEADNPRGAAWGNARRDEKQGAKRYRMGRTRAQEQLRMRAARENSLPLGPPAIEKKSRLFKPQGETAAGFPPASRGKPRQLVVG